MIRLLWLLFSTNFNYSMNKKECVCLEIILYNGRIVMWCSQPMKKIIFYSLQIFRSRVIETQNSLLLVLVRMIMYTIIQ